MYVTRAIWWNMTSLCQIDFMYVSSYDCVRFERLILRYEYFTLRTFLLLTQGHVNRYIIKSLVREHFPNYNIICSRVYYNIYIYLFILLLYIYIYNISESFFSSNRINNSIIIFFFSVMESVNFFFNFF